MLGPNLSYLWLAPQQSSVLAAGASFDDVASCRRPQARWLARQVLSVRRYGRVIPPSNRDHRDQASKGPWAYLSRRLIGPAVYGHGFVCGKVELLRWWGVAVNVTV